ncbi:MAG: hypothetical protein ABH865_00390 [Candidatus Omnitrophota bacterium]
MKKLILFLVFAFLSLSSTAFADIKTEADMLKKDLISFHNKMAAYQREESEPSNTMYNKLYTDQAGELFVFTNISRAYLNYARFLLDEIKWLKLDSDNELVRGYLKNSLSNFNKEGEFYVKYLAYHIEFAKNLEMTKKLQILKEDIAALHTKIKKFSDNISTK